jgi:hypothetical protein
MSDPWKDPERYKTGRACVCLGCGNKCRETLWGKWCYRCNVERIERINKSFEPFAKAIGKPLR